MGLASEHGCPWCLKPVYDDDTVQEKDGVVWHARCKDQHDTQERVRRTVEDRRRKMGPMSIPNRADMQPSESAASVFCDADAELAREIQKKVNAQIREERTTIFYTMTPDSFRLDIPVGALANLSPDAHTRLLAMVTDWINRHKPLPVLVSVPKENKP